MVDPGNPWLKPDDTVEEAEEQSDKGWADFDTNFSTIQPIFQADLSNVQNETSMEEKLEALHLNPPTLVENINSPGKPGIIIFDSPLTLTSFASFLIFET